MEVEQLCLKEPQWILDRKDSGPLFWRRDSSETARVKFRYEVDIKEFQRGEHEFEEQFWPEPDSPVISTSMSVMFCITVTVILPWLLFAQKGF
ncbi:uncharacterized protein LOC114343675 [Diabrotica virgifera virgifera]|uniref:Uncharacterized protein LOC114343675 n=1 Tax=Diabrotica virgifera virgifera TaxID=50390 RepID=A0A6P7GKZ5_DIAVI|nr:uncharacterized protein LOC114343675 [Diabrotica virgifera virgifera]